jgi:hypothetical protein
MNENDSHSTSYTHFKFPSDGGVVADRGGALPPHLYAIAQHFGFRN